MTTTLMILGLVGTFLIGLVVGLTVRGCVVLGDKRQLDLSVQRLIAEARMTAITRQTLAAIRQTTRQHFRS